MRLRRFDCPWLVLVCLASASCVEIGNLSPPVRLLPEAVQSSDSVVDDRPFVGLTVEEALSGSLEQLEFMAGLRVVAVAAGSPAESAGIRSGDLLVGALGVELNRVDQWQAIIDSRLSDEVLPLEIERDGGVVDVELMVGSRGGSRLPHPTRFAERYRARLVAETVNVPAPGGTATAARVIDVLDGSPLLDAGVEPGELIWSIDGSPLKSARDLTETIAGLRFGAETELEVGQPEAIRAVSIELWEPESYLTGLQVPILFSFGRDLVRDQTDFALIDLFILAVYDYHRDVKTSRHRFLHFFVFESGTGELDEAEE